MRPAICFVLAMLLGPVARAQDLIVTVAGDSISCVITTVTPKRLFYKVAEAKAQGQQDIALDDVAMYRREGYHPVVLNAENRAVFVRPKRELEWWLTGLGGFSYRTAKTPDEFTDAQADYVDELRSAWHAAGALHCFVGKDFAVGLEYNSFFGSKASMTTTVQLPDSSIVDAVLADDIRLRYLGADLLWRSKKNGTARWFGSIGLGRLVYEDRATIINKVTLTGSTFAMVTRIGCDLRVAPKMTLGLCAGYFFSRLDEFEVDTGSSKVGVSLPRGSEENLNRLDISVTARLHL